MASINHDDIIKFWNWFTSNCNRLRPRLLDDRAIAELEKVLQQLGAFDWEIGPGFVKPYMFAVSPTGSLTLLELTREIVRHAPSIQDWEFYSSKPRRQWKLRFEFGDVGMVDAHDWEFVVHRPQAAKYDIIFKAPENCDLSQSDRRLAATIIAEGELGEEKMLEKVNGIMVVNGWTPAEAVFAQNLEVGLLDGIVG